VSQEERAVAQPQNKGQDKQKVIEDLTNVLVTNNTIEHTIRVDPNDETLVMKVNIRELSFMDMQKAIKEFVSISAAGELEIDLAGYWRYMYDRCIVSTEPSANTTQLLGLNHFVGSQLSGILPQPQDLLSGPLADGNSE